MGIDGIEKLEVYNSAIAFSTKIFQLSKNLPPEEKYRLSDQMIRSSRSCPANIAEGYGRFHFQENIQFCRLARGSILEMQFHIKCALDCNYIDKNLYSELRNDTNKLVLLINGYIRYLKKRKS